MAPFHFPPNGASDLSPTPDAAANKDREAEIVVDDNDVIDVAAEKRYDAHISQLTPRLNGYGTRLLRQLDLRIIPAFVAIFISAGAASESLVRPSLTIKLPTNKDVLSQGNSIILNADTGDSLLQVLHMTRRQFLALASISLVSRVLFPIPSNYMLKYFSPPSWLAFIVLGSGASLMVMAASQNYITVLFFRLLMSAFSIGTPPISLSKSYFLRIRPRGSAWRGLLLHIVQLLLFLCLPRSQFLVLPAAGIAFKSAPCVYH